MGVFLRLVAICAGVLLASILGLTDWVRAMVAQGNGPSAVLAAVVTFVVGVLGASSMYFVFRLGFRRGLVEVPLILIGLSVLVSAFDYKPF